MKPAAADYDVMILGGAFSGASAGIILKRDHPELRVLIVERTTQFDRKVGESTSEVAGCFLTRVLHQSGYLSARHYQKHGLRMWFCKSPDDSVCDLTEIGPRFQARLPTYQLDRSLLDEHLLAEAQGYGCEVMRPATVRTITLSEGESPHTVEITPQGGQARTVSARWVVDASGKAAVLAKKLGLMHSYADEHPTSSIWCRYSNVNDLDSFKSRQMFPSLMKEVKNIRSTATNHLMGHGWWSWIIPLSDRSFSVGVTWDRRVYNPPEGPNPLARLHAHLMTHPVGRLMFEHAKPDEDDVFYYKNLIYRADRVAGNRWVIVGDAAGFMDPLYSHGLDFCGHTVSAATAMILRELKGECVKETVDYLNMAYPRSWRLWFEALYKDKYFYLGDAELMHAAFLMDLGTYFIGPVRLVYDDPEHEWNRMPYHGRPGGVFGSFMAFYNRRLSHLGRERMRKGIYGAKNHGHVWCPRFSFSPDTSAVRLLWDGIKIWLKAEITTALASPVPSMRREASGQVPVETMEPVPAKG
ncbi:MAG: tryptophan 7-halogenase [Verrucomicrobiaceae bacterium]|jgi:flavin-dependent dehydrogenase|nr:tryptophan 7-halogenase [Verrucomicrobiaceae bacterium]